MDYTEELYLKFTKDPSSLQEELAADVRIKQGDLANEMARHSELYLKWARLHGKAESEYRKIDRHINLSIWPAAKEAAREFCRDRGEKGTKDQIEEYAGNDPAYLQACSSREDAEALRDTLKAAQEAMWQRKEMLTGLNIRQTKELSTLPS